VLAHDTFEPGVYCVRTEQVVAAFQQLRGLPVTGTCDHLTWTTLVESSWVLGARLLYLTSPHMRGDDVQAMQTVLAKLGFDCGRADGIFGPNTLRALTEFQQNYGITADGICGVNSIRALERTSSQSGEGPGIVTVREYETLLTAQHNTERPRIVVGCFDNNTRLTRLLVRELRNRGDDVMTIENADPHAHARTANSFGADLYLGVSSASTHGVHFAFYETDSFVSAGGKVAAELCAENVRLADGALPISVGGMQLPVLRETRMPAVMCTISHEGGGDGALGVVPALAQAITQWGNQPL
jgi:N-acetylmuramoyl-L-alanine amidase